MSLYIYVIQKVLIRTERILIMGLSRTQRSILSWCQRTTGEDNLKKALSQERTVLARQNPCDNLGNNSNNGQASNLSSDEIRRIIDEEFNNHRTFMG